MLAAYLDELERLIATLPAIEAAWIELPDDVADPPSRGASRSATAAPSEEEASIVLRAVHGDGARARA